MASSVRIAVDAMGGEFGPSVTVSALITSLKRHPNVEADLFGNKAAIAVELNQASSQVKNRISVYHSDIEVCDNDKPSTVLRNKKDSSMGLAINAVATRQVDACISAGNPSEGARPPGGVKGAPRTAVSCPRRAREIRRLLYMPW